MDLGSTPAAIDWRHNRCLPFFVPSALSPIDTCLLAVWIKLCLICSFASSTKLWSNNLSLSCWCTMYDQLKSFAYQIALAGEVWKVWHNIVAVHSFTTEFYVPLAPLPSLLRVSMSWTLIKPRIFSTAFMFSFAFGINKLIEVNSW